MNKSSIVTSFFNFQISEDIEIVHVTDNSRDVRRGSLFIARQGFSSHGEDFIDHAISNGAVCVISNKKELLQIDVPFKFEKDLEEKIIPFLFKFYELCSSDFLFFGITGTNGKTSTAFFAHQIMRKLNKQSSYIGTLGALVDDQKILTKGNTTPGIFELFDIFQSLNSNKKTYVFLEVSSHALDQNRLLNLEFFQTMLLNIQSDHLDYHLSLDNYIKAKLSILNVPSRNLPIVNIDSELININLDQNNFHEFHPLSFKDSLSSFSCKIDYISKGTSFMSIDYPNIETSLNISLFPKFNLENLAHAIALISNIVTAEEISILNDGMLLLPPGRCELIELDQGDVFIDFAHDPKSMQNILSSLKESYKEIILVFGCGGDRDKQKRPEMMKIATGFSKIVLFTSDNSRNEDFLSIAKDAINGYEYNNLELIESRDDAIKTGLKKLNNHNVLAILGKGHETFIEIAGKKILFNDRDCVLRNARV